MILPQSFLIFVKITMSIFDFPTFLCNFAYSYNNHLHTFSNEKEDADICTGCHEGLHVFRAVEKVRLVES